MNKQKSVILSIALLSALSAGITADAREGLRLSTDPKLTEIARCITARHDSGISNRKAEHSGVFEENSDILDVNEKFAVAFVEPNGEVHIGRMKAYSEGVLEITRFHGRSIRQSKSDRTIRQQALQDGRKCCYRECNF